MIADVTVTRSGEMMVAGVDGHTEAGVEFVDAWIGAPLVVPDSGRIVISESDRGGLVEQARALGLRVEEVDGV